MRREFYLYPVSEVFFQYIVLTHCPAVAFEHVARQTETVKVADQPLPRHFKDVYAAQVSVLHRIDVAVFDFVADRSARDISSDEISVGFEPVIEQPALNDLAAEKGAQLKCLRRQTLVNVSNGCLQVDVCLCSVGVGNDEVDTAPLQCRIGDRLEAGDAPVCLQHRVIMICEKA